MTTTFTFATEQDIRKLEVIEKIQGQFRSQFHRSAYRIKSKKIPWNVEQYSCDLDFPKQFEVIPSHVFFDGNSKYHQQTQEPHGLSGCPFFVHVKTQDRNNQEFLPSLTIQKMALMAKDPFIGFDKSASQYYTEDHMPSVFLGVTVKWGGVEFILTSSLSIAQYSLGAKITENMQVQLGNGAQCDFPHNWKSFLLDIHCYRRNNYRDEIKKFDYTADTLKAVNNVLCVNADNQREFVRSLVKIGIPFPELPQSGIKKTLNRLQSATDELIEKDPLAFVAMRTLVSLTRNSVDGVKISVIFNEIFKNANTAVEMIMAMEGFYDATGVGIDGKIEKAIKEIPLYKKKRKKVLKSQANRAFTKIMQETESLTIDKKKHKRTWKAIEEGRLPIGTFFRKSEQYFLLNDNWELWEEMFKRGHGELACEFANEVKGRTTYEKDLMSYFYFLLYGLPAYLNKHTGRKWTCIPRIVNSESELEPPKEDENGITRGRSALTPTVDNEANTVEVPYASLCIHGHRQNTYCYSHDYHVLTKGFSFNGNVVMEDIEKELNGRDDYGLMFYTLTGSMQGRGYPSFLIIFERRTGAGDTRVHFHRIHPSRSKDGDYNPIHRWIKVCYNWMAGNIKHDRIKAQQGDLAFVQIKTDKDDDSLEGAAVIGLEFNHKVNSYDSHCFDREIDFAEYAKKAKSNILGYVKMENDVWLRHPEHDDVSIPAGTYAIHQCRSWEANPKGVWSLNID